MKEWVFWVLIVGVISVIVTPIFWIYNTIQTRSDELYTKAGCEDLRWKPIPQHFLDSGYYVKDGWTCPK